MDTNQLKIDRTPDAKHEATAAALVKGLTPNMKKAIKLARKNNGKLKRYDGGYWAGSDWENPKDEYYGTRTIEGLVLRGAAVYTKRRYRRNWSFGVEITLTI